MIFYRLTDRAFSRVWRRNKDYTERQLKLLAKHTGTTLEPYKGGIRVKKGATVVANFKEFYEADELLHENHRTSLFAALRNPARGRIVVHTVRSAVSVANVAGESRGGSSNGGSQQPRL